MNAAEREREALAEVREAATDAQAARASLILWNIDPPERALAHNVTLLNAIEAIVSAAERAVEAARREEREKIEASLVGTCPHGNLKCFYCWRDAGFPGGAQP
jgi:hypothetical protein